MLTAVNEFQHKTLKHIFMQQRSCKETNIFFNPINKIHNMQITTYSQIGISQYSVNISPIILVQASIAFCATTYVFLQLTLLRVSAILQYIEDLHF